MAAAAWIELPIRSIEVGERLRSVDPATVANLKVGITESGWFGSILVRPIPSEEGEARYALVAGAHRLAAMTELGQPRIAATIRPLSDDEAIQIEIDENLIRRGLTPLERAEMVAARFDVWARRFPSRVAQDHGATKPQRGRPRNSANFAGFSATSDQTMGFAAETANEIGLSKRTVEAAWATVTGLPQALRQSLRNTPVAKNEGLLRQLAAIGDKAEQAKAADILVEGGAKTVADALAMARGEPPSKRSQSAVDEALRAFRKIWKPASPVVRAAILHELAGQSPLPDGWMITGGPDQ